MRKTAPLVATMLMLAACGAPAAELAQRSAPPLPTASATPTTSTTPTASATPTATSTPTSTPTATTAQAALATEQPAETTTAISDGSEAEQMLSALNERRSEQGCPALVIDDRLQAAAQGHADDLFARQAIDHVGADGATLEQRLQRAGYLFERRSEVIARAHGVGAPEVVDQWLAEPPDGPHRASVLNCAYADAGIGWRETDEDVATWVVDFGEPQ